MVYVLLAEGFEEIEALAPIDFLRRAGVDVSVLGLTDRTVTGAHGIPVVADALVSDADFSRADALLLPGGMPGTKNLDADPRMTDILSTVFGQGGILAAICAAPMVLGTRGYLEGKKAICYPGFEEYLKGAEVSSLPVVCDGRIITAKSAGHAWEFGYRLGCALVGRDVCEKVREGLYLPSFGC